MKQSFILLFLGMMIASSGLFAQYHWTAQTSGVSANLKGVYFVDQNNGWVVGSGGAILHTVNAGQTWTVQNSGTTGDLTRVWFTDNTHGIALGFSDYLRTTDGGITWTKPNLAFTGGVGLWFVNSTIGWIHSGDSFYKTINGGNTWSLNASGFSTFGPSNLQFSDANNGHTVCNHVYTTDGGSNWNTSWLQIMCDAVSWVWFTSATDGYVVDGDPDGTSGGGFILKTTDGGGNWGSPIQTGLHKFLNCVVFTDNNTGWISGRQGALGLTTDAGTTWTSLSGITTNDLYQIFFFDHNNGWVVGNNGTILHCTAYNELCIVTVDETTGKNKLLWEKQSNWGIASYNLYRENTPGNYVLMGNVPFGNTAQYVDVSSTPEVHSEKYKITFADALGNESMKSPYHQTISLGVTQGVPATTMTLIWSRYEDESGNYFPDYYYIWRGTSPTNLTLKDSVSGVFNIYNDLNVTSLFYYQITVKKNCGSTIVSESNTKDNNFIGINENLFGTIKVSPNPFSESTIISIPNIEQIELNSALVVTDVTGKIIREIDITNNQSIIKSNFQIKIDRGDLKPGIYFIEVKSNKLYRGKIIVQ